MNTLILSLVLMTYGCGNGGYTVKYQEEKLNKDQKDPKQQDPNSTGGKDPSDKEDPIKSGLDKEDPVKSSLDKEEANNGPKALSFVKNTKLDGVDAIFSASKIIDTLYFTGEDVKGNIVLGRMKPDEKKPTLLPLAKMNDSNIKLSGKYYLPTNADEGLFLMNDTQIVEIDLVTMKAVSVIDSDCAIKNQLVFEREGRWNQVWNSSLTTCGMIDGSTIKSGDDILDGYTGEKLIFGNYSRFNFDGINIFKYSPEEKTLTVFDSTFAKGTVYSTSNYLYNGASSSFVSDNTGNRWFFGCSAKRECFKTEVTMSEQ